MSGTRARRAGGDDHRLPRHQVLRPYDDPALAVQTAAAAHERDAALLEPGQLTGVVEMGDDVVTTPQDGRDVDRPELETGNAVNLALELDRTEQRLRRHAGVVRALPADEPVLDDRHLEAVLGEPPGRHLAGDAGTDHDNVEFTHCPPVGCTSPRGTCPVQHRDVTRGLHRVALRATVPPTRARHASPYERLPFRDSLTARRAEVLLRQRSHDPVRAFGRVERRDPATDEPRRDERAAVETAVATKRHPQDAAERERAAECEDLVAGEVPERVRDQPAPVPLHSPQHVGAVADHDIGTGVDDGVREGDDVAPVLAEVRLGPAPHVCMVGPLCPRVHRHDDDVCIRSGLLHEPPRRGDVRQPLRPRVRGETDDRNLDLPDLLVGDGSRAAGNREVLGAKRSKCLRLSRRAVVEGVVVRDVHDREAGSAEPGGVCRRRLERVAVSCFPSRTWSSLRRRAFPRGSRARRRRRDRSRPHRRTSCRRPAEGSASTPSRCRRRQRW